MSVVLALDLATTTGWALHAPGMERPFFGAFRLPGGPHEVGPAADAVERWLRQTMLDHRALGHGKIDKFFFEAQHIAGNINIDTVYKLIALGGIVEKFAWQTSGKVWKVEISKWRKHFIGSGSGFKARGQDPKEMAIQRCGEYGWHTDQPDAAEALGILDYALTMVKLPDGRPHPRPWRDKALLGGS